MNWKRSKDHGEAEQANRGARRDTCWDSLSQTATCQHGCRLLEGPCICPSRGRSQTAASWATSSTSSISTWWARTSCSSPLRSFGTCSISIGTERQLFHQCAGMVLIGNEEVENVVFNVCHNSGVSPLKSAWTHVVTRSAALGSLDILESFCEFMHMALVDGYREKDKVRRAHPSRAQIGDSHCTARNMYSSTMAYVIL